MSKVRTQKVVCYIVRSGHVVTFTHDNHPLDEVGVQVPAGTIKTGETPEAAALREAVEETGLRGLRVVRKLGEGDYDISPYRHEIMRRHFFELTTDDCPRAPWWGANQTLRAAAPDPHGPAVGHLWTRRTFWHAASEPCSERSSTNEHICCCRR